MSGTRPRGRPPVTRLQVRGIYTRLTPFQRARSEWIASDAGTAPDSVLRATLPRSQFDAFAAAHAQLGMLQAVATATLALVEAALETLAARATTITMMRLQRDLAAGQRSAGNPT